MKVDIRNLLEIRTRQFLLITLVERGYSTTVCNLSEQLHSKFSELTSNLITMKQNKSIISIIYCSGHHQYFGIIIQEIDSHLRHTSFRSLGSDKMMNSEVNKEANFRFEFDSI